MGKGENADNQHFLLTHNDFCPTRELKLNFAKVGSVLILKKFKICYLGKA